MTEEKESRVCRRIRQAAQSGTLSHALILSGEGDRLSAARFASAAMECTAPADKPCLKCNACRKVMDNIHPDVTFVRDDEHKMLALDVVREARHDAYIRPNEGARKVYVFENCELLTEQGQNVLLKIVEEGPAYVAFIFCTENIDALLPTIRSRCVELKMGEAAEETAIPPEASELCQALAEKNFCRLLANITSLEVKKTTREQAGKILSACRELLADTLLARYGKHGGLQAEKLTDAQLAALAYAAEHYAKECEYHVGVGHVLFALAAEWEEIL